MTQPANLPLNGDRAFPAHPRLDRYFPSSSAEEARMRLMSCIKRGDGPAVLIGASGSGKSMLLEVLADAFSHRFAVAHLASTQLCTRRALLQAVLHALDQPHRDREEGELRLALADHLQDKARCPSGALLLIDEAQSLAPRLLEEVRVLGNLARRGEPLVRIVMAGSTQLEESLASPELETLNQRIAARCYLAPLSYEELSQYIRAHIAATGADPDELLGIDAVAAVFEATDGIPRLINQLCDRAIVLAVASGAKRIDRHAIQNAWADLHQLPAPWHSDETLSAESSSPLEVDTSATQVAEVIPQEPSHTPSAPPAVFNADEALAEVAAEESALSKELRSAIVVEPVAAAESAAVDPFGEDFEEEETLLDRFVGAEAAFPPGIPQVTNTEDAEISSLVATLAHPIVEEIEAIEEVAAELKADEAASIDPAPIQVEITPAPEPVDPLVAATDTAEEEEPDTIGLSFPLDNNDTTETELDEEEEEPHLQVSAVDTDSDPAVLLIEEEAPEAIPLVRRQEYRQLFSSLRGG